MITAPSSATPAGFGFAGSEPLFYTPLLTFRLADSAARNDRLIAEITALRRADPGVRRSNRGGWHSRDDLFARTEPELARLAGELRAAVIEATRQIAPDTDFAHLRLACEGWINVNPPGAFNAPHDHPGWFWSGCYYVATPAPQSPDDTTAGCFELLDSRTNLRVLSRVNAACMASKAMLRPEAGMLVLFPSHVQHWVYPNGATTDRISIAFNARFEGA